MDSSRGNAGIYNGLSILFLTLTALVIVVVIVMLLGPAPEEEQFSDADLPAIVQLPSVTPSETPRPTLPPTFTHTPTTTPSPTNTVPPSATITPSPTITDTPGPTLTASDTPSPSVSPTSEFTATAVGPTATPVPTEYQYFFDLRAEPFYQPNAVNSAGCAWEGVGGNVLDANGIEIVGRQFQVRVFGTGIERTTLTGSNSLYGQLTGWEVQLGNTVSQNTYIVRLETTVGTQISRDVQVTFRGDCNANSAIITFYQVRPFGPPG